MDALSEKNNWLNLRVICIRIWVVQMFHTVFTTAKLKLTSTENFTVTGHML